MTHTPTDPPTTSSAQVVDLDEATLRRALRRITPDFAELAAVNFPVACAIADATCDDLERSAVGRHMLGEGVARAVAMIAGGLESTQGSTTGRSLDRFAATGMTRIADTTAPADESAREQSVADVTRRLMQAVFVRTLARVARGEAAETLAVAAAVAELRQPAQVEPSNVRVLDPLEHRRRETAMRQARANHPVHRARDLAVHPVTVMTPPGLSGLDLRGPA